MSPQNDSLFKEINVHVNDDFIKISNKSSSLLKAIVTIVVFTFLVSLIFMGGTILGNIFLALIAALVAFLGWQEFSRTMYPITILNLTNKEIIRSPAYRFIQSKTQQFKEMRGISVSTKTVGGHTSAYEEGNTDYEKVLLLETEMGDFPLLTLVSREEETEPSLLELANTIKQRLLASNDS